MYMVLYPMTSLPVHSATQMVYSLMTSQGVLWIRTEMGHQIHKLVIQLLQLCVIESKVTKGLKVLIFILPVLLLAVQ